VELAAAADVVDQDEAHGLEDVVVLGVEDSCCSGFFFASVSMYFSFFFLVLRGCFGRMGTGEMMREKTYRASKSSVKAKL
jgi:hypothetical protein